MRVLFVHNALTTFVRADLEMLSSQHEVDELDLSSPRRLRYLPVHLARADLLYVWFAGLHALLPVALARAWSKRSIVVVGGYDTAALPEIGYGHIAHRWKRHIVRFICNSATTLLVNSHSAAEEVRQNTGTGTPIEMIYHGFPAPNQAPHLNRQAIVLSVGGISRESLRRKGHEAFVRAAALLPSSRFVLAGTSRDGTVDYLRSIASANVDFVMSPSDDELQRLYREASVYVQASAHEGFGCAVVEAMLAGCVPVVSKRGALPEVVGDYGVYTEAESSEAVAEAARTALERPPESRIGISAYAMERFPLDGRRAKLLALVERITEDRRMLLSSDSRLKEEA